MKIGRYRIFFGKAIWFKAHCPIMVKRFWGFIIVKEARPTDVDEVQQFPIPTTMMYEGRRYKYCKFSEECQHK